MEEKTLGARIAQKRKENKLTQEELAEQLNLSPQAISKWENDQSCPDILLLPKLTALLGITVDELLGNEKKPEVTFVPEQNRKKLEDMMLHIYVNSHRGDRVKVNLPLGLVKVAVESGASTNWFGMGDKGGEALKSIDFEQVFRMVERGITGKLVEVESAEGDVVEIVVE